MWPVTDGEWNSLARPEDELLVCCARASVGTATAGRIEALLRRDLDWAYLIRTATQHGMKPLLYWTVGKTWPEVIPQESLDQLRDDFRSSGYQNLLQTRVLLQVLSRLSSHGIRAIPFKGPVLAQVAYGNLSLRYSRDLDILVRREDVQAACELLPSLGYRLQYDLPQNEVWRAGQLAFVGETVVELHWDIAPTSFSFPLEPERLWGHLRPMPFCGSEILALSPEDHLLLLCIHGAKHRWERLAWICDIGCLIRARPELDWADALQQARASGLERMFLLGLSLAAYLLGEEIPAGLRESIQARPAIRSLTEQVCGWLFLEAGGASEISKAFFHLRVMDRWGNRIRYILGRATATTAADRAALSLPQGFSFFHLLLRPLRLLRQYGRAHLHPRRARKGGQGSGSPAEPDQP